VAFQIAQRRGYLGLPAAILLHPRVGPAGSVAGLQILHRPGERNIARVVALVRHDASANARSAHCSARSWRRLAPFKKQRKEVKMDGIIP
jgi:hypothetical protein